MTKKMFIMNNNNNEDDDDNDSNYRKGRISEMELLYHMNQDHRMMTWGMPWVDDWWSFGH